MMTVTLTFHTFTFFFCAVTFRIITVFTGAGHAFFFLTGFGAGTGRFFSDTTLNFITFAILLLDKICSL